MKTTKRVDAITGVKIIPKKKIHDDRGAIYHMLRSDDPEFQKFGEIYFSKVFARVVKAWHLHQEMTLNYLLVSGSVRLVLFDDRKDSPTIHCIQELLLDESTSRLIIIPPLVWNGFKGLGTEASIIANCSTVPHSPEEIIRRPHDDLYFGYDWTQPQG